MRKKKREQDTAERSRLFASAADSLACTKVRTRVRTMVRTRVRTRVPVVLFNTKINNGMALPVEYHTPHCNIAIPGTGPGHHKGEGGATYMAIHEASFTNSQRIKLPW